MSEENDYAFELFPRQDLRIKFDRRHAIAFLTREIGIRDAQEHGGAAHKLSALGSMEDARIALVAPIVAPGWSFVSNDDFLYAERNSQLQVKLFPLNLPATELVRAFNGRTTLSTLASDLADATGWDAARALEYARGVFLHLVQSGICLPN